MKFTAGPGQIPSVGVTVIVEVIVALVEFVATKTGISPFPDAPNPVAVLLFVQANVEPAVPEKITAVVL